VENNIDRSPPHKDNEKVVASLKNIISELVIKRELRSPGESPDNTGGLGGHSRGPMGS